MNPNDQVWSQLCQYLYWPTVPTTIWHTTTTTTTTTPLILAQPRMTISYRAAENTQPFPLHWMFNSIFPSHISPLATYSRIASGEWNWLQSCSKYLAVPVNWKSNNLFELFISSISVFPRTQFPILELRWTRREIGQRDVRQKGLQ